MPFEAGNKQAAKSKAFHKSLMLALNANGHEAEGDPKRLRKAAEMLVSAAEAGEQWAIRELADRLDGKPSQDHQHAGTGENGEFVLKWSE
jgi:hypothetical protein